MSARYASMVNNMCLPPTIGGKHRALRRGLFRATGMSIEFATGEGCASHRQSDYQRAWRVAISRSRPLPVILTLGPVARGANGVIGRNGALPWRLKSDLALFRQLTMARPVIMGRKTWDSLPRKPLPGRVNIVLSRDGSFAPPQALVCEGFSEAVQIGREQAEEDGAEEICVIGGAGLFATALPRARRIYLTEVDASPEGDVFFPPFDETGWTETRREAHSAGPEDDHPFVFRVLERRQVVGSGAG